MNDQQLLAARERMHAMLSHTSGTLQTSEALLKRQRVTVEHLEWKGYPSRQGRELYAVMTETVEILRWQKAWIEFHLRETSCLLLQAQPHPWTERPPADLLSRICAEFGRIDVGICDREATDLAVNAAFARAAVKG